MSDVFDEKFFEEFVKLPIYEIELGVQSTDNARKRTGLNNAELMFIHENGSRPMHIPKRPVLEYTIEDMSGAVADKAMDKAIQKFIDSDFNQDVYKLEIERFARRVQDHARDIIYNYDKRLIPNSPRTIKKKKNTDHPLFDTGQLARSITTVVKEGVKINNI